MKKLFFVCLLTIATTLSFSFENDLTSITHRTGTNELYVGGEFNTIFVINADNGEEIRRLTLEGGVLDMQFSPDGSKLLAYTGRKVIFMDPVTGEEGYSLNCKGFVRLYNNSPYFVDCDRYGSKSVIVYSAEDGSQVFNHTPGFTPMDAAFDSEYNELIIMGSSVEMKDEKKYIQTKIEPASGYNVYNKAYVEKQADKKGAGFEVVDLKSKTVKIQTMIPFQAAKTFGFRLSKFKDNYYLSCWDMLVKINPEGAAFPIPCNDATFAYATNAVIGSKYILVASTKNGYAYDCESEQFISFDARQNNEFAYTVDIADYSETVYVLNKDYSISILNAKMMVLKEFKIDNSTGKGFGIYYTNGYNKKESRDKEAAIINDVMKELGQEGIDLEAHIGEDAVLIGTFETIEDAEKAKAQLSSKGLSYLTKIAPIE